MRYCELHGIANDEMVVRRSHIAGSSTAKCVRTFVGSTIVMGFLHPVWLRRALLVPASMDVVEYDDGDRGRRNVSRQDC